jgi:hypothetical protein
LDILKAANKVGSVAGQAMATAVQQRQLEIERKVLQDLRAEALSLRANIGEEIFKQWKAGRLPSSGLDDLLQAVDSTSTAIRRQRQIIEQLLAGPVPQPGPAPTRVEVFEEAPAAASNAGSDSDEMLLSEHSAISSTAICASCGATDVAGKRFCGSCGTKMP